MLCCSVFVLDYAYIYTYTHIINILILLIIMTIMITVMIMVIIMVIILILLLLSLVILIYMYIIIITTTTTIIRYPYNWWLLETADLFLSGMPGPWMPRHAAMRAVCGPPRSPCRPLARGNVKTHASAGHDALPTSNSSSSSSSSSSR